MRILCLHGQGSSAEIFKRQLAPLQFLLPSTWTYDFIDSSHPCSAADELNGVYPGPYYCYFPKYTPEAMDEAVQYVQEVVEEDGPYDCVIGFSQGASVAAAYLAHSSRDQTMLDLPFRMAIFICAALIPPSAILQKTDLAKSIASFGSITLPVVSVVGKYDLCLNQSIALAGTCVEREGKVVLFEGGHEPPKERGALEAVGRVVERVARVAGVRH